MIDTNLKDMVLRCAGGPCWLVVTNGEVLGLEVAHTGSMASYDRFEAAAEELVREGLLRRGGVRRGMGSGFSFTERGKIAYWALGEWHRIQSDRRSGRAA